jgi:hypothetical protein
LPKSGGELRSLRPANRQSDLRIDSGQRHFASSIARPRGVEALQSADALHINGSRSQTYVFPSTGPRRDDYDDDGYDGGYDNGYAEDYDDDYEDDAYCDYDDAYDWDYNDDFHDHDDLY